jgi:hypothetical protein
VRVVTTPWDRAPQPPLKEDDVSQTAEAGRQVGSTAKEQATEVVGQSKREVRDLLGQSRSALYDQTAEQQKQVAGKLRTLADDLGSMAGQTESGQAGDLVHELSSRTGQVAEWLEREPSQLLDDVSSFARRRPGAFLAVALGAGLLVGRLGRGAKDAQSEDGGDAASDGRHVADTTGVAPLPEPVGGPVVGAGGAPGTVAGAHGDPLYPESGSAGLSGPAAGGAAQPRDGLSGPYDDPLR